MQLPTYVRLEPGATPQDLQVRPPFKAVLVIDADTSSEWRAFVADWLVRSGCRYLMAWGRECARWHDAVDLANVRAFGFETIPEDEFVMTTSHGDGPLEDVFWFAETADHPTLPLETACIIHIAQDEQSAQLLKRYRDAQDL